MKNARSLHSPFRSITRQNYILKTWFSSNSDDNSKNNEKFEIWLIFNFKCLGSWLSFYLFSFSKNQSNNQVRNIIKVKNLGYFLPRILINLQNEESSSLSWLYLWTRKHNTFNWLETTWKTLFPNCLKFLNSGQMHNIEVLVLKPFK